MMRPEINYYALLGVTSTATPLEIKIAYRKKILEVHLDKRPGEDSDTCYKTIEAYRVLSDRNLRAKYDIQRDPSYKSSEIFIPFGYICYDVGTQMSKSVMKNISSWKEEFDLLHSTGNGFSDNYFECFSALMGQVIDPVSGKKTVGFTSSMSQDEDDENELFFCDICDTSFLTESRHWDDVLHPYISMFSSENVANGVGPLLMYFERLLGTHYFNWEPRYLPTKLLGIWGAEEWNQLGKCDKIITRILNYLPDEDEFSDTNEFAEEIRTTFLTPSEDDEDEEEFDEELYPKLACELLCWVVENQDDQEKVVDRVQDYLCKDELMEIMFIAAAMKNYLGCEKQEWKALAGEAVKYEQAEMAMLWVKISIEFSPKKVSQKCGTDEDGEDDEEEEENQNGNEWYNLAMQLHPIDPVIAHFCFISHGLSTQSDWDSLASEFSTKKDYCAGMEYFLIRGDASNLQKLLDFSRILIKTDPTGANIFRTVYYSLRVKSLLSKLQLRKRGDAKCNFDSQLEELIELIQELDGCNPLEGFRLIANTWPKAFESSVCQGVHRGTAEFIRRSLVTIKSFNLIIGSMHFIPEEEVDQEQLTDEACQLVNAQIQYSLRKSDFDSLTEILQFVTSVPRGLQGAVEILEEFLQDEMISESPHLKAMKLLIEGTVSKINKDWMSAMNQYQNALLCSPECMHRVLPCISKLSQDIEFHEAVVTEVQTEVKELKELFDCEEYPEVDNYSSNNRNSLVLTDVMPKIDYGYKNSVSKIQPDPEKMTNLPPPDDENFEPPPVETNTPLITLDKNEEAINKNKDQLDPVAQLNSALSYIDLLKALPLPFHPGPIVMAASHFLRAMDGTNDPGSLFAYRNAILQMAENLLKIDRKTQATIQHCLTHKHMLSILLSAHEKMSKSLWEFEEVEIPNNPAGEEDCEEVKNPSETPLENGAAEEGEKTEEQEDIGFLRKNKIKRNSSLRRSRSKFNVQKDSSDLIKTSDVHLISRFLKNVVNVPKIQPLANIPTLNCSDLVYVETLGNSFLSQFCSEKVGQKYQSPKIPKHLHAYTHLVEVWKGRSQLVEFSSARFSAMEELLALRGWSLDDVETLLGFPLLNLTDDGWSSEYRTELKFPNPPKAFRNIYGFKIHNKTGRISFLLTKDKQTAFSSGNLFDTRDIVEIFSNGIEPTDCTFSLESPDVTLRSHPFKQARFIPNNKAKKKEKSPTSTECPNFFQTLARASNLLCYFSSGLEICSKSPFHMKPTDEGLLLRLEEHLQHILRPTKSRREDEDERFADLDIPPRFWLNFTEIFEEDEENQEEETFTYKIGEVKAQIKMNTFVMTLKNGGKSVLSPEGEFAKDFTNNYDEIGKYFPELLRLKELIKIGMVGKKLREILKDKVEIMEQNGRSKEELTKIASICKAIKELGISAKGAKTEEKTVRGGGGGFTDCIWFPATFCNNFEPEVYEVSGGVRIKPQVTFMPVQIPTDCNIVGAKELFAKKKMSFVRR